MNTKIKLPCLLAAGLLGLAGCPGDDTGGGNGTDTDPSSTTMTASSTMSTTAPSTTESSTTPMTDTMMTETDPTTMTDTDTTGPNPDVYDFREDDPSLYTQLDRMGLPAVNTVLIFNPGQKDNYNASDNAPNKDATWNTQFQTSLSVLHLGNPIAADGTDEDGLNDDLATATGLGVPEAVCYHEAGGGHDVCIAQLLAVVPWVGASGDSLQVDTTAAAADAAFPNGRRPADVVIDPILSALLLNWATDGLDVTTLVGVLNPTENTEGSNDSFPYLVDAN